MTAMEVSPHSVHGGPDARGAARHDFSTNANACGPCPMVAQAVRDVDASRYPDPRYTALRARLSEFHGVDAERIVMVASASEFMQRISALAARTGLRRVLVPRHGYGDYSRAARAWGLEIAVNESGEQEASLQWACDPASPTGRRDDALMRWDQPPAPGGIRVLDCAYVPLMLDDVPADAGLRAGAWQLWTPNKALAMTGVRAAYAIAPEQVLQEHLDALHAMSASWPVGAHGVAMLNCWVEADVQRWVQRSLETLRLWKARQVALCERMGWEVLQGSLANYFTARLPADCDGPRLLARLREDDIQLRDCASFGLPHCVRLGVLAPVSQAALEHHWIHGGYA